MKRHFQWLKFLWSLVLVLTSFLSVAATFPQPFNWISFGMNHYRAEEKSFLMNRIQIPDRTSAAAPKKFSPIETAWQSYRAVSISS